MQGPFPKMLEVTFFHLNRWTFVSLCSEIMYGIAVLAVAALVWKGSINKVRDCRNQEPWWNKPMAGGCCFMLSEQQLVRLKPQPVTCIRVMDERVWGGKVQPKLQHKKPLCKKDTGCLQFQRGAIEGDWISFTFPPPNPAEVTVEPDPWSYENRTCPRWLRPQSVKLGEG